MLEKYRSENQRIVSQKDRDIETLRQQVAEGQEFKVSFVFLVKLSSASPSSLSPALHSSTTSPLSPQNGLESELETCQSRLSQLEKELGSKDEEMKELLKAIECMQTTKVRRGITTHLLKYSHHPLPPPSLTAELCSSSYTSQECCT